MGSKHRADSTDASLAELPLATAPRLRELFGRVVDREHMLALFRRELPPASAVPIRVTSCDAKARFHRDFVRMEKIHVVYRLGVEVRGEPEREFVLLGVAPVGPEFLDAEIEARSTALRGHPWAMPFQRLTWYDEESRLALLLFPLDPALPGLADLTGREGARVLAACLPECSAGARVEELHCELQRYNPLDRAVLRVRARLAGDGARERVAYVKIFADESGAFGHRDLVALRSATLDARALHLPEALGYDAQRRMLVLSEAPGERALNSWIKSLEKEEALPSGVDLARLECCILVAAHSLRELQRCDSRPARKRTFRDELGQLGQDRELLPGLRAGQPELVARAEALLQRLEDLAPAEERLVPAHGSFRHKQMLGDEHHLALIDWDGYCLASPALDAATFLGRLRREPVLRPGSVPELERMAGTFRDSFLDQQPELARDLALYEALVLTEQMLRSFRRPGAGAETADQMRHLADGAEALLAQFEGDARTA